MPSTTHTADLVILVPDRNMESAVKGILSRPQALGIREISFRVFIHIERDPGCYHRGHDFLKPMLNSYSYALVMLDRVGCGQEASTREDIEQNVRNRLAQSGWGDRAEVVVLDPELEIWIWSNSPEVSACLGWPDSSEGLRRWLIEQGLWKDKHLKPTDPKLAVERVLHQVKKPRSSALYEQLGRRVSFQRCTDPAFQKFLHVLQAWFGR